jgi:D-amino-acid oxidase
MNRRHFLRHCGVLSATLAGASSLPWLSGCAPEHVRRAGVLRAYAAPDISFTGSARDLPPVHVAPEREIRTVVGLRPYRPSGFVVRAEKLDDTLVVHNYGHGGSGITLS